MEDSTKEDYAEAKDANSKSSSIYERLFPMRIPLMAIGAIVFLIGLGMFIGGFAGLVADMDVKIRRSGSPNIGYMLMLIVSVVVMIAGGISLFCGCGAIRHNTKKNNLDQTRKNAYKVDKVSADKQVKSGSSIGKHSFTSAQVRTLEPNGDVTYTVTYQYRGPPPAKINGLPAYPAPPSHISPTLKIDPLAQAASGHQNRRVVAKPIAIPQRLYQVQAPPLALVESRPDPDLALSNVPRKLVLIKRV